MKKLRTASVAIAFGAALLVPAGVATAAANPSPSGTGKPSQSCEDIQVTPGHAETSPGSPFNETGAGGIGGQHYSETSQYDVACFQVSQH